MDRSNFEADAEDGAPLPGARRPVPWTELRISSARVRRRRDGESVFIVCEGRLAGVGRIAFFLTLADNNSSFAVERGVALARAVIAAGSDPATTEKQETFLAAVTHGLAALRPIEVMGVLVEQSGTFTPRLEIDDVRAAASTTTKAGP